MILLQRISLDKTTEIQQIRDLSIYPRVSLEILGGRPERGRVCRPAIPSFRYRLRHLTPHDGAMPRRRAAPVTLIPSLCTRDMIRN